jgi:hypothetical protein
MEEQMVHYGPPPEPRPIPNATGEAPIKLLRQEPIKNTRPKIGRNAPCPCGSGVKWKRCHYRFGIQKMYKAPLETFVEHKS